MWYWTGERVLTPSSLVSASVFVCLIFFHVVLHISCISHLIYQRCSSNTYAINVTFHTDVSYDPVDKGWETLFSRRLDRCRYWLRQMLSERKNAVLPNLNVKPCVKMDFNKITAIDQKREEQRRIIEWIRSSSADSSVAYFNRWFDWTTSDPSWHFILAIEECHALLKDRLLPSSTAVEVTLCYWLFF